MSFDLAGIVGTEAFELASREEFPEWVQPMLATLYKKPFSSDGWIYERKFDGERCLVFKQGGTVRLLSRNKQEISQTYPEIVEELAPQGGSDYVMDGEIVAFEGGATSFARLQERMRINDPEQARASRIPVYFYAFDVMHINGWDVTGLPQQSRKTLLNNVLEPGIHVRLSQYRSKDGEQFFTEACSNGWEGLIAKKVDAPYKHSRSTDWLKFKCVNSQDLIIGGFTDPKGSRAGFGALLGGYYRGGDLVYAGRVGTGFDKKQLSELYDRLKSMETDNAPFANGGIDPDKSVHWVKPELVCEVTFTEWTPEGKLRHPSFLGLRRDKPAKDVTREDTG